MHLPSSNVVNAKELESGPLNPASSWEATLAMYAVAGVSILTTRESSWVWGKEGESGQIYSAYDSLYSTE